MDDVVDARLTHFVAWFLWSYGRAAGVVYPGVPVAELLAVYGSAFAGHEQGSKGPVVVFDGRRLFYAAEVTDCVCGHAIEVTS